MEEWIFAKLPSVVGFGITYCALFSFFFLLVSKKTILSNRKKIFLLFLFSYMFAWRIFWARASSRYSLFLVFPAVFLFVFLVFQFKSYHRIFLYLFWGYLVYLAALSTIKIYRNHDVIREEAYYGIRDYFHNKNMNTIRLVCDNKDINRFAYYSGIKDYMKIERESSSPQDSKMALLPAQNYFRDVYVILQDSADADALSPEQLDLAPSSWILVKEHYTNKKQTKINRLYHLTTTPTWHKTETIADRNPTDLALNGDFESSDPGKQYNEHVVFPYGWDANGKTFLELNPHLSVGLETEHPISGKNTLRIESYRLELLNRQHYQPNKYSCRFLLKGGIGSSVLCRIYIYPKNKNGYVVNLEKYEIENTNLYQCDFKIKKEIFPEEECDFIFAFILNGDILIDNFQVLATANEK